MIIDPLTELVTINGVRGRDAGVAVAFDVVLKSAESFLPLIGVGIPCPTGQLLESTLTIRIEGFPL